MQVRGPQHNMLAIVSVNQDIETALKQDKSEGAMSPLGPIVAIPVALTVTFHAQIRIQDLHEKYPFSAQVNVYVLKILCSWYLCKQRSKGGCI